jgi:hypothetical protein
MLLMPRTITGIGLWKSINLSKEEELLREIEEDILELRFERGGG